MNSINYIFIGSFVGLEDSKKNVAFSQAGILLQSKIIDFLDAKKVISLIPIFVSKQFEFRWKRDVTFIHHYARLPFGISRLYKLVFDTLEALRTIKGLSDETYVVYNVDKHNALLVLIITKLLKRKVLVVIADHGGYGRSPWDRLIKYILRSVNGTLVLNSNITCNDNTQVICGLLRRESIREPRTAPLRRTILLTGSLGKTTGLQFALEFFSNRPDCQLYLAGKPFRMNEGDFRALIDSYTSRFTNIKYMGLMNPDSDEYDQLLADCDIGLSLRDPDDEEHNYNFPSKILEYLSKSMLVISTIRYDDVPEGILQYADREDTSLGKVLDELFSRSCEDIYAKRKHVHSYLEHECSKDAFRKCLDKLN